MTTPSRTYLGIDHGSKRVGVAISDPEGTMAFPRIVLANTKSLADDIAALAKAEQVETIVLGESLNYAGKDNPIMEGVRILARELETRGFRTALIPEHLSSREAAHIQGELEMHDASAAAIILQSFLDRERTRRGETRAPDVEEVG